MSRVKFTLRNHSGVSNTHRLWLSRYEGYFWTTSKRYSVKLVKGMESPSHTRLCVPSFAGVGREQFRHARTTQREPFTGALGSPSSRQVREPGTQHGSSSLTCGIHLARVGISTSCLVNFEMLSLEMWGASGRKGKLGTGTRQALMISCRVLLRKAIRVGKHKASFMQADCFCDSLIHGRAA
jgi:hypothetical protein